MLRDLGLAMVTTLDLKGQWGETITGAQLKVRSLKEGPIDKSRSYREDNYSQNFTATGREPGE